MKAADSYRLLIETYGELTLSISTYEILFQEFKRGDFNECSDRLQTYKDEELQLLLNNYKLKRQFSKALPFCQGKFSRILRAMKKINEIVR